MRRNTKTLALQLRPALAAARRLAALAVLGWAGLACAAAAQAQSFLDPSADYDPLPDESPALLSELFYAAGEVPGVAELPPAAKRDLLDAVTERHKSRLANRAAEARPQRALDYLERLSRSELVRAFPAALRQACARHGRSEGPCAPHRGYVRRVLVLEEMLAGQRLSLDSLEVELLGAARPALRPL